jgi:hypothetical protein
MRESDTEGVAHHGGPEPCVVVRGRIAACVYAAVIEARITAALCNADIGDPDLPDQHLSCARALRELNRIRDVTLTAAGHTINVHTRPDPLQRRILAALNVDTTNWDRPRLR